MTHRGIEPNANQWQWVTIGGPRWRFSFTDELPDGERGECEAPTVKGKRIRVSRDMLSKSPFVLMRVLLHEFLHAADWSKDEEWVEQISHDLARVLVKQLGLGPQAEAVEALRALRPAPGPQGPSCPDKP